MEYKRDEHRVHLIVYHLIWCPRRRRKILTGEVALECENFIRSKALEKGWEILELAMQPDHIHLFIRVFPSVAASQVVKELKGGSSRAICEKFPELRYKVPSIWTRSYFACTAGNVSAEAIEKYIKDQSNVSR